VAVDRVVKRFGAVTAVDHVSLDIAPGSFVALLGPSGSGKTTILLMVAGFEFPDAGRVLLGGEDVTELAPFRRNLGMVFQRYTLFPHMSVLENIAFPLKMRGVGRAEREARARRALETVRLGGYGDRRPSQLSGGQQQRIAVARAIVYEPRVLLMDEPLSALDKNLREEMQLEVKHLQRELGITVVFVTHDQTEALTMADRIAVLDHGRLQQIGAPKALYERPETPFVAGFIGETNFIAGTAKAGAAEGTTAAIELDGGIEVRAVAASALATGARVRLAVRPERLQLAAAAAGEAITGKITEAIYVGVATTFVVETPAGTALRCRVAMAPGAREWRQGDVVGLGWSPQDARAFPDEGRAA
jgi:putative spermidine/putrescine transport system ATP-binding protein/mannopine transport system ATP-binding protein